MPRQPKRDGTPGKKPPAPSVKVRARRRHRRRSADVLSVQRLSALRQEAKRWRGWSPTRLTPKARRVLQLLAIDPRGLAETLLRTYGITLRMLGGLIRAGLATAQRQTVKAGGQTIKVVRIRITEAGWQAIKS